MKRYKNEWLMVLLLAVAALLALPLYRMVKGGSKPTYYLLVNEVAGMSEKGTLIYYKGMNIGQTVWAEFEGDRIVVAFELNKKVSIPKPARPELRSNVFGLVNASIYIETADSSGNYYRPGDTLYNLDFVQRDTMLRHRVDSFGNQLLKGLNDALIRSRKNTDSL